MDDVCCVVGVRTMLPYAVFFVLIFCLYDAVEWFNGTSRLDARSLDFSDIVTFLAAVDSWPFQLVLWFNEVQLIDARQKSWREQ